MPLREGTHMKMKSYRDFGHQLMVSALATGLLYAPLADYAHAATPLADIPIASKVSAKPNIVYTMDDSGSMQFGYLPDWTVAAAASAAVTTLKRVGSTA